MRLGCQQYLQIFTIILSAFTLITSTLFDLVILPSTTFLEAPLSFPPLTLIRLIIIRLVTLILLFITLHSIPDR